MNEWEKTPDKVEQTGKRDNPEQYPSDKESMSDRYLSERHVDQIPMEDLKLEAEEERRKTETKHHSSSDNKYRPYDN
ncbi:hypothetical protein [Paenibacillus abyssi]|uniref:Uncharacterized protein n=1 Tax=Paenibacillus abyssi TaxID=1340531 RepID=A0A917FX48_9BACL|nr:hypothetical protein [Paenibacillus abyssi]GGG13228.1 hypothetical protein GCM10010916_32690 [Paenibacillus abyssi]